MTAIKLTPESLTYDCQKFYNAADELNRINNEIARLVSSLDWEVRSRGSVENMIVRAAADGSNLASGVESLAQYLKTAANLFQEADANGKTSIEDMTCKMPFTYAKAPGFVAASLLAALFAGGSQCIATELGWLKKIMGIGNTADSLSSQNIAGNVAANNSAESVIETATNETSVKNYQENTINIERSENDVEIDSFEGIPAYAEQKNFDAADKIISYGDVGYTNGERSCAEYVKRFYATKYHMTITGLLENGTPSGLKQVTSPNPGDVMYVTVNGGPHWAIVKQVDASSGMVTVIEQNTVFKSGSGYAVKINHQYDLSAAKFFSIP